MSVPIHVIVAPSEQPDYSIFATSLSIRSSQLSRVPDCNKQTNGIIQFRPVKLDATLKHAFSLAQLAFLLPPGKEAIVGVY